ncbi:MAG: hypothetical protein P1U63_01505 [Coxiellaceae bacterium]|nr:hypothetical protein [Coxiellaceae bacterium]
MAQTLPLPSSTVFIQRPPNTTDTYFNNLFTNLNKLNAGRVMPAVDPPTATYQATKASGNPTSSGILIQKYSENLPSSIKFYAFIDPTAAAWASYTPTKPINITCPTIFPTCIPSSPPAKDSLTKICNAVKYTIELNNTFMNNKADGKVNKLTGVVMDHEGFPLGSNCNEWVYSTFNKLISDYYQNNPVKIKLAWIAGSGKAAFPANQSDLTLLEIYDFSRASFHQHLQCAFDNVAPGSSNYNKILNNCILNNKTPPALIFPGFNSAAKKFNGIGDIYNCSINSNPNLASYCSEFNKNIQTNNINPDKQITQSFNLLLTKDPKNNDYSSVFQQTYSGAIPSTCTNTVFLFSTQYYGNLGATQGCTKDSSNCNCILKNASSQSTGKGQNICSFENGFGAWSSANNWPKSATITPYQAFINVVRNFVTAAIPESTGEPSGYPCKSEPTVGIWMYDFIPQDWLPPTLSTSPAQKTTDNPPTTGTAAEK